MKFLNFYFYFSFMYGRSICQAFIYTISSQYVRELTLSSLRSSTPSSETASPREDNLDGINKLSVKELLPLVNQVKLLYFYGEDF